MNKMWSNLKLVFAIELIFLNKSKIQLENPEAVDMNQVDAKFWVNLQKNISSLQHLLETQVRRQ